MAFNADSWKQYLAAVDSLAASEEELGAVSKFFEAVTFLGDPSHLEGQEPTEVLALPGTPQGLGAKGLIRRAIRAADAAGVAKRLKPPAPSKIVAWVFDYNRMCIAFVCCHPALLAHLQRLD